ncbi:hypothetical protein GW17_00031244 [Ensete ventricosum]|nr:hypothetical protein GW17_00031244 [Ensete ventricosum]
MVTPMFRFRLKALIPVSARRHLTQERGENGRACCGDLVRRTTATAASSGTGGGAIGFVKARVRLRAGGLAGAKAHGLRRRPRRRGRVWIAVESGVAGAVEDGGDLLELGDGELGDLAAVKLRRDESLHWSGNSAIAAAPWNAIRSSIFVCLNQGSPYRSVPVYRDLAGTVRAVRVLVGGITWVKMHMPDNYPDIKCKKVLTEVHKSFQNKLQLTKEDTIKKKARAEEEFHRAIQEPIYDEYKGRNDDID